MWSPLKPTNDEPRPAGADGHDSLSTNRFDSNSKFCYGVVAFLALQKPTKKREIQHHKGRPWRGLHPHSAPNLPHKDSAKNGTKLSLSPQTPCSPWIPQSWIQLNGFWLYRLISQSQSATDSLAPQHHKTENKRSARRRRVGKRWQVPPAAAAAAGLQTVWPNSPDAVAIYQADCNEQKHYQGTFCSPLNSVSVLCHYLVSVALRDRPA